MLVAMVALATSATCHRPKVLSNPSATKSPAQNNNSSEVSYSPPPVESHSKENEGSITINSIAFYGWWWSDEQLAGDFNADNPPPKNSYIKLEQWTASQPDSPHPDRIDVRCVVKNATNQAVDLHLVAIADFKVASYKFMTEGANSAKSTGEALRNVSWTENRKVGQIALEPLAPGQVREIQFRDVSVRSVVNKYLKTGASDLWPWRLRISITVRSGGKRVAYNEATIDLIPGD